MNFGKSNISSNFDSILIKIHSLLFCKSKHLFFIRYIEIDQIEKSIFVQNELFFLKKHVKS